ncbi:putative inner membrane protein [Thiorhodovibrio winogradskyi]|uniref:Inner membrane protein n=1 Tax=Thiorhodovibrio winogradskyi TaxID=77007 RepID=A0ABZ0SB27_9GAMM|nr:YeeE/YedE thiosulfate transporter family protein [Thiorhodovibrio winogradskyi]
MTLHLSLRKQWPFWVSGVFVGVAEVMHYIAFGKPINLTTGLVQMTSALEQTLAPGLDWWSRAFAPDVHWGILGIILGAWLVARMEGESRRWRRYPRVNLWLAFFGGLVFSLGARLANGCTTHHFLGGISSMSVASLIFVIAILPAGFLTFYWMTKLGVGNAFKGQENRATAQFGYAHGGKMALDGIAWDVSRNYQPNRNWPQIAIVVFLMLFFGNAIVGSFLHQPVDGQLGWNSAVSAMGWGAALWLLLLGVIAGIGMAKTGFGTECAMMTPEISMGLKHDQKHGCSLFEGRLRISGATRFMFGSMSPFTAIFIEFVILWVAIMIGWQVFGRDLPFGTQATWVFVLGALMQGFGSVAMIGCEIRTYMRLGLGYATAVAAFPGFLIGYLPYTLFQEWWQALASQSVITEIRFVPELFGTDPTIQFIVALLYGALLISLVVWSVRRGMRLTGTAFKDLATTANDELAIQYFQRKFPEDQRPYLEQVNKGDVLV